MTDKPGRKSRKGVRPLVLVGSCLLMSGVIRIAGDVAPALAEAKLPGTETAVIPKTR